MSQSAIIQKLENQQLKKNITSLSHWRYRSCPYAHY